MYAFLVCFFVKKRSILSLYKKNVLYLIIVISLVYLTIYYLSGIKFGYLQSHKFSFSIIFKYILPFSAIIISSELIRHVFLAQNKKCVDLIAYISSILIDYLMVYNVFSFNNFNMFIDIMSLTLLPSIMFNILYHNLSKEYGLWPGISFRLVLTLYPFIIPIIPNTPESLVSLFNLFVPLLI